MKFTIAICDDDITELNSISNMVEHWSELSGHSCQIRTFPSAESFLFQYQEDKAYDILLLDVEMKEMSGIDLAREVRKYDRRVEIIFITSHFEFAGEGYEVDALHYLTKPLKEEKFLETLHKAADKLDQAPAYVIIQSEGEIVKLYKRDVLYIEAFLHYLVIHTKEREYRIKESISSFEEQLGDGFYRSHRSYLVSLQWITRIQKSSVILEGGAEIPLARGKYDEIHRAYILYH